MLAFDLAPSMRPPRIAIVIPTLDEEQLLARHLPAALAMADEVVVSDGGSSDGTLEVARSLGARVVTGPAGRGAQLNRGVAATAAPILLFLHADTRLPAAALESVREAVARGAAGGGFLLRFEEDLPKLRLGAWLINLRTRLIRLPLGDQAQFVTRQALAELGGLRDWPLLEDVDLAWRLKRAPGGSALLAGPAVTSGRRFIERGVLRTVTTNWWIVGLFLLGVSPVKLARLYRLSR